MKLGYMYVERMSGGWGERKRRGNEGRDDIGRRK